MKGRGRAGAAEAASRPGQRSAAARRNRLERIPQGTLAMGAASESGVANQASDAAVNALKGVDGKERRDVNTRAALTLCDGAAVVFARRAKNHTSAGDIRSSVGLNARVALAGCAALGVNG